MEDNSSKCPVCREQSEINRDNRNDAFNVKCPRCGDYSVSRNAKVSLNGEKINDRQRANISGWIRENQRCNIEKAILDRLERLPTPSFHSRADKILLAIEQITEYAGQLVEIEVPKFTGLAWCFDNRELVEILEYLCLSKRVSSDGFKSRDFIKSAFKILPDGWAHLEKLKSINADMQQGFVAMWFDPSMARVYEEAIDPGIDGAGYKPFKIDQKEHTGKIDDEIIAQIRRSRFVVADFTGHRGGVYFEAGFARGLGIEVIWTCREDHLNDIHFDIRQYNCIVWAENNLEDFRKRLQYRIESVLGRYDRQPPENPH
jgi:nucleoside 2-deoxyribosyltransferase/endogenous inhibitor of DNA gyrase (YacG/DUF329 family)